MDLVSIIMPVYNSKEFVSYAIESILAQTYQNWQLIIVDDSSNDGSYEFITNRYSSNKKINVFQNAINLGAAGARNKALKSAKGKYIAFLDADDIWHPNKLDKQVNFMKENNYSIVHTNFSFIDERGNKTFGKVNVSKFVDLNKYMKSTEIGMSTVLINKAIVGEFRFNEIRMHEDAQLWLELLGKGFCSHGLNEDLVEYRVREGQLSQNKISAALSTFKLYIKVPQLPLHRRLINFCFYASNGILKRIKK